MRRPKTTKEYKKLKAEFDAFKKHHSELRKKIVKYLDYPKDEELKKFFDELKFRVRLELIPKFCDMELFQSMDKAGKVIEFYGKD